MKYVKAVSILLLAFLVWGTTNAANAGDEDRRFEAQRIELADRLEKILIARKYCDTAAQCFDRGLLFVSPGKSGVSVSIYMKDSAQLFKDVFDECFKMHLRSNHQFDISIRAYQISKDEELRLRFWQSAAPVFSATLSGRR